MTTPTWYDRAAQSIEDDLESGRIDYTEYNNEMRSLNQELDEAAEQAGRDAYSDYLGRY